MYVSKMHLPRRTMLRGLGAAIALPVLESMVPAFTAIAQSAAAPVKRMGVFYVPNGMSMPYWLPKAEGPLSALPPTLQSLTELKDRVLLCAGLADTPATLVQGGAGDHARSAGTFLTGVPFKVTQGADVLNSVSMDQMVARELEKVTQLASLELGIESNAMLGNCDGGASCAYTNTISWRTPTTPLPIENDPRAVFERLFGTSGSTELQARLERIRRDRSILDFVDGAAKRLNIALAPEDKLKVNEYFESIRDIERRIQMAEQQGGRELPVVDQPVGVPGDYAEHAKLMMDLLLLAYQTDMTRVSTFMLAREVSARAYPEIGITDSHHPLSHHQDEAVKLERLHKINEHHFQQFAYLVKKMAKTKELDGTMLDSTLFLYGTGISDSNTHFHDDLPIAVVAGGKTGISGGRMMRFAKGTPVTNLYVSILEKMGIAAEKIGDSTGKATGLSV